MVHPPVLTPACPLPMKSKLITTLLLLTVLSVHAQTVRDKATHQPLKIPPRFVVTIEGIQIVAPGADNTSTLNWGGVDAAALATEEPEIAAAKEQAELGGPVTYFTVATKPNLLTQFLALPYQSNFNEAWSPSAMARSYYRVSETHFPPADSAGNDLITSGFASAPASGSTDTTIEEIFMTLSRENDSYVRASIKKIQSGNPNQFARLKSALEKLLPLLPKDPLLPDTVKALDVLTRNVDLNAQRQLAKFVRYAKSEVPENTRKNAPAPSRGNSSGTR